MASKNLGAVIQRAISDGAFRRQLQSDPAAALRGFNLSPDEIAAVRSGDSSKLMSLGVDQRMSKAFTLGAQGSQATRAAMTGDVSGSTTNVLAGGDSGSTRDGIAGDPTSGARAAINDGGASATRGAMADGDSTTGARDAHSAGSLSGTRATIGTGQQDTYRAVNDPDNTGGTRESVSDSTLAGTHAATTAGDAGAGNANIMADDNYSVASRMHDANADQSLPGSDVQHDPGFVDTHNAFIPSDSADVQRELQDGLHGTGDALGHSGVNS